MFSTQARQPKIPPASLGVRILRAGAALRDVFSPQAKTTRYGHEINAISGVGAGQIQSEHSEYLPGLTHMEAHPDMDLAPDTPEQRRRCTLAYYNTSLVKGIVDSQVRQVISNIHVQAETGSHSLNERIEDEWKRFMYDRDGLSMLQMMMRHAFIDGGSLLNPLSNIGDPFEMQVIPYRLISNPYNKDISYGEFIRDGFRYDKKDRQQSYFVAEEKGFLEYRYRTGIWNEIPLFYHCAMPRLVGQTRGLSWYTAAIARLELLARWMDAMLQTLELHAYFVGVAKSATSGVKGITNTWSSDVASGTNSDTIQSDRKLMDWARKHKFMILPMNGDMKLLQTQAPQLGDFLVWSLRFVARALGVSFERLTYDLTKTNYSSTKFGDRDDQMTVGEHQDLALRACTLINRRILFNMALENKLVSSDFNAVTELSDKVKFLLPERPPVDEQKFAQANKIDIENQTNSRTRICASLGVEWNHVLADINEEAKDLISTRKALYGSFGVAEDDALKMAIEDFRGDNGKMSDSTDKSITGDEEEDENRTQDSNEGVA